MFLSTETSTRPSCVVSSARTSMSPYIVVDDTYSGTAPLAPLPITLIDPSHVPDRTQRCPLLHAYPLCLLPHLAHGSPLAFFFIFWSAFHAAGECRGVQYARCVYIAMHAAIHGVPRRELGGMKIGAWSDSRILLF